MNTNEYDNQEHRSVIAIAKTDNEFRAIELRLKNGAFEVVWARSKGGGETNWQEFAAECGLSIGPTEQTHFDTNDDKIVVLGFDSAGTVFYRVNTPEVEEKEIEAIVKLQAESRLPLPIDQMELAWHTKQTKDRQIIITMAAARKSNAQAFVDKIKNIKPKQILLDCEGTIKALRAIFSEREQNAIIINAGAHSTQVCLTQNGQLSNSVALDMGIDDFAEGEMEEATETTERFIQDMTSVVDLFDHERATKLPVLVLSNGNAAYVSLVSALRLAGLNARIASPDSTVFVGKNKLSNEDIHKYRTPIGLALVALDDDSNKLNLFEHLYNPAGEEKEQLWFLQPKVVYSITAVMLVLLVLVSFTVVIAKPGAIEKRIKASGSEADLKLLMERQRLKKTIAQQRPDLLSLLNEITACGQSNQRNQIGFMGDQRMQRGGDNEEGDNRGGERGGRGGGGRGGSIQLDSFHFRKGQPVTISGQASSNDQLYSFEKNLEEIKDIREVKRSATTQNTTSSSMMGGMRGTNSSPRSTNVSNGARGTGPVSGTRGGTTSRGNRGRGINFTITFHYKNFTE
ncbi:MAG: hypothetical protein JW715_03500 [Sedimentisphaerales bacterium]|nr:hypothetical protein [Sedimentisphaerales bacterium]